MPLNCGIVGLPNAGKSTIFNALTAAEVPAENYPFCTVDPNTGIVPVPDERLPLLAGIFKPEKVTPATVELVDIAGLVRGASKGEGLGNRFLANISETAAIIHVVRCFEDPDVSHVDGSVNAVRDVLVVETELLLRDLEAVENRIARREKKARSGDKQALAETAALTRALGYLDAGKHLRKAEFTEPERAILRGFALLTMKPVLYVANVDEDEIRHAERAPMVRELFELAEQEGNRAIRLCGKIEQEIALLPDSEKELFVTEYGLKEIGLSKLIHAAYDLLDYLTFFTGGPKEVRAWTVRRGATAPEAAGVIHTDFQHGFIKAEVYHVDDLVRRGSEKAVRDAGLCRMEGKTYRVRNGDVIYFRFNV